MPNFSWPPWPSTQLASEVTTGELVAVARRCRSRLEANKPAATREGWAPGALADQLAYDVALVRLSRQLGVASDVRAFGRPPAERLRLEAELSARGFEGSVLDGPARLAPELARNRPSGAGGVAQTVLARALVETGGKRGSLGPTLHSQLRQQVRDVVLDRLFGEVHRVGNLAIGEPVGDESEDPALLGRQAGQVGVVLRMSESLHHPLREPRIEERLSGADPAQNPRGGRVSQPASRCTRPHRP